MCEALKGPQQIWSVPAVRTPSHQVVAVQRVPTYIVALHLGLPAYTLF